MPVFSLIAADTDVTVGRLPRDSSSIAQSPTNERVLDFIVFPGSKPSGLSQVYLALHPVYKSKDKKTMRES